MNYTPTELATRLHDVRRAKEVVRNRKLEIVEIAVSLGLDQASATQNDNALYFVDGWIAAHGSVPAWRIA